MAQLRLELEQNTYRGEILGERFEFSANRSNTYCLIQFLRGGVKNHQASKVSSARNRLRRLLLILRGTRVRASMVMNVDFEKAVQI
jgi:hypothetical protein